MFGVIGVVLSYIKESAEEAGYTIYARAILNPFGPVACISPPYILLQ